MKNKITERDNLLINRKLSREEEIELHNKPINHNRIVKSKKKYSRKNYKLNY